MTSPHADVDLAIEPVFNESPNLTAPPAVAGARDACMPVKLIPTDVILPASHTVRDEIHFRSSDYRSLEESVKHFGGNLVPICVRERGHRFELVYGSRRLRACQTVGLDVLAIVVSESTSLEESLQFSFAENNFRSTPSALEVGRLFRQLLEEKIYPSIRKLAEKRGISHTYVNQLVSLGRLPDDVIFAFADPHRVTAIQGATLHKAMHQSADTRQAVIDRACDLMATPERRKKMSTAATMNYLLGVGPRGSEWQILAESADRKAEWRVAAGGKFECRLPTDDAIGLAESLRPIVDKHLKQRRAA